MSSKKFYLAGPMTGIPQFNFPAFHDASTQLRGKGWGIISPAEMDSPAVQEAAMASPDGKLVDNGVAGETWGQMLARDVRIIADDVNGVVFLPGWEKSRGARLEAFCALLCKGHEFYTYRDEGRVTLLDRSDVLDMIYEATV